MVMFVIAFNILISLIFFYAAWRVWQIKHRLANIADALTRAERSTYGVLNGAPSSISQYQRNASKLRIAHRSLKVQVAKLRQVLGIVMFGQQVWQRYARRMVLSNQRLKV